MILLRSLVLFLLASLCLSWSSQAQLTPQDLFQLTSPDFAEGGRIPKQMALEDENKSPTLEIAGTPKNTQSLVLIVDDPDAPSGTFTHWLVWNIPPGIKELVGGALPSGVIGKNGMGKMAYSGPNPPSGEHRYYFRLMALSTRLNLPAGSSRQVVEAAIGGHILATATLMGRYAKTATFQ